MRTEIENLFIRTLKDLERKVESIDPYEVLGASGLIRKLLLDDYPLVDQVNRKYHKKLHFDVGTFPGRPPGMPKPIFYTIQDGLDPETSMFGLPAIRLTRDEFLRKVVVSVRGTDYSVREVVLFEANIMGGIHAGTPKKDKEKALHEINSMIGVGGSRSSLRQLKAIGRVTLKAMFELREEIETMDL